MQKQKKQFVILCVAIVVFGILFAGLKWFGNYQKTQAEAEAKEERIVVASLNTDDIQEFSYLYEGEEISFVKTDGVWHEKQKESTPISQTMIAALLSNLEEITAQQQINTPEDIRQYGFDSPLNVITLYMGDTAFTITIGMQNTITSQYYLMVSDNKNVYVTDNTLYAAFLKSLEDLTETTEDTQTEQE